ncbi:MAG: alkaline phosphatase D family protein [Bacteroidales bacterium]
MKRNSLIIILVSFFIFINLPVTAQKNKLLQSGPMLGYSEMLESLIWVQTTQEASVYVSYYEKDRKSKAYRTNTVITNKEEAFTANLIADSVEPGKRYIYQVIINGQAVILPYKTEFQTQSIWKWRGNPPAFRFLTGSCAYINQTEHDRPGKPYGGEYQIFTNMTSQEADFTVWLGDNFYYREPDWNSWTGIINRNTHTRSNPEMQALFASTHNYFIWDDHDYGPNDSDKGFYNKEKTLEAFKLFYPNPSYGTEEMKGVITSFQWADADFFLLDNRWYRDPNNLKTKEKSILGKKQLEWLFDNLVYSQATFKFVAMGGQFLSTAGLFETYYGNGFENERQAIIDFIYEHNIKNVIFLTGDVHFTEISVLKADGKPTIWDLTFSPFTSGPNTKGDAFNNTLRVPGTVVMERNYGMIDVSGVNKERKIDIKCFNADNIEKWKYTIVQE